MLKFLLVIVLLIWLFYSPALRGLRRQLQGQQPASKQPTAPHAPAQAPPERMVRCVHCGVHLPASDALHDEQGRDYCNAAHRAAGPRP